MIIHKTVPYFLENFTPTTDFIKHYQQKYDFHKKMELAMKEITDGA